LVQGDMQRETVFAEDPVAVARDFERAVPSGSTSSTSTARSAAGP